jgi:hypothetical protein
MGYMRFPYRHTLCLTTIPPHYSWQLSDPAIRRWTWRADFILIPPINRWKLLISTLFSLLLDEFLIVGAGASLTEVATSLERHSRAWTRAKHI